MLSRKKLYLLWILGFGFAATGASWDASYHFKFLQDLTQAPHILNAIGNMVVLLALFFFWKSTKERKALKIVLAGFIIFLIDIPLDQLWHKYLGLDLTTWSPTHMLLYYGATVSILGVIKQLFQDGQRSWLFLIFFVLLFNSVWFPMIQQEQGVVALYQLNHGTSIVGKDVLRYAAVSPEFVVYKWAPDWLYLTYAVLACLVIFSFIKMLKTNQFACTVVVSVYLLFRLIMDQIYAQTAYQQSTIPYFLIPAALLFDLVWNLKKYGQWEKILALILLETLLIYSINFIPTNFPIHPPMTVYSLLLAIPAGILGYFLARFIHQKLF